MTWPIHFETHGEGPAQVVICNGLSQTTANWRGIARQNPQFRWILFDARGHGKSLVRKRPYCLDDHVEDLCFVLEHAGAQKPVVVGFSHGARVALRAAARHPEWFAGLVLTSCGAETTPRRRAYVQSWMNCLKLGGLRALAWSSLPAIVGPGILQKFPDLTLLVNAIVARNQEEGLLAVFEAMPSYPEPIVDAQRISLPALILSGGEDPLVGADDVAKLRAWISGAQAELFDHCGHTLPLEEPRRFIATLQAFHPDFPK